MRRNWTRLGLREIKAAIDIQPAEVHPFPGLGVELPQEALSGGIHEAADFFRGPGVLQVNHGCGFRVVVEQAAKSGRQRDQLVLQAVQHVAGDGVFGGARQVTLEGLAGVADQVVCPGCMLGNDFSNGDGGHGWPQ